MEVLDQLDPLEGKGQQENEANREALVALVQQVAMETKAPVVKRELVVKLVGQVLMEMRELKDQRDPEDLVDNLEKRERKAKQAKRDLKVPQDPRVHLDHKVSRVLLVRTVVLVS